MDFYAILLNNHNFDCNFLDCANNFSFLNYSCCMDFDTNSSKKDWISCNSNAEERAYFHSNYFDIRVNIYASWNYCSNTANRKGLREVIFDYMEQIDRNSCLDQNNFNIDCKRLRIINSSTEDLWGFLAIIVGHFPNLILRYIELLFFTFIIFSFICRNSFYRHIKEWENCFYTFHL